MNNEEWLPIKDYEGLYEVSSLGRVRSLNRTVDSGRGYAKKLKGNILQARTKQDGYLDLFLHKEGIIKHHLVHRLVAAAFVWNPFDKPVVNHKDCARSINTANNLEWATTKENIHHSVRLRKYSPRENTNMRKKFGREEIDSMLRLRSEGQTLEAIAKQVGSTKSYVGKVCRGDCWAETPRIERENHVAN